MRCVRGLSRSDSSEGAAHTRPAAGATSRSLTINARRGVFNHRWASRTRRPRTWSPKGAFPLTDKVLLERQGAVAHLILNRPEKFNAIDEECLRQISEHIRTITSDCELRALVVRGHGRGFCAGGDLGMATGVANDARGSASPAEIWHQTLHELEVLPIPTIAAVHGMALAGGLELASACDFLVVAEDARIGDQHANYGIYPGGGASQRLPRLIGERRAKWLLMSGQWIDGRCAEQWGLANEAVPADELLTRAQAMAELLASRSPLLNAEIKEAVRLGMNTDLTTALRMEIPRILRHMDSEDVKIGLRAFRTRTTPEFVGR